MTAPPTVAGYKSAADECERELQTLAKVTFDDMRSKEALIVRGRAHCHRAPGPATLTARQPAALPQRVLVPVIASKQMGYEELLAGLVADAVLSTMPAKDKKAAVTVDNVRTCKIVGGSPLDSQVVRGVVVQRDTDGSIKHAEKAKIAVFACSIEASSSETKGVVVI
jgi:chaperonin GroEL (HSP60 family)